MYCAELGVLVLVDEHVAKAGVEVGAQLWVALQGQRRHEQQIVEVQGVGGAELLFVDRVNVRYRLAEKVAGLGGRSAPASVAGFSPG